MFLVSVWVILAKLRDRNTTELTRLTPSCIVRRVSVLRRQLKDIISSRTVTRTVLISKLSRSQPQKSAAFDVTG